MAESFLLESKKEPPALQRIYFYVVVFFCCGDSSTSSHVVDVSIRNEPITLEEVWLVRFNPMTRSWAKTARLMSLFALNALQTRAEEEETLAWSPSLLSGWFIAGTRRSWSCCRPSASAQIVYWRGERSTPANHCCVTQGHMTFT